VRAERACLEVWQTRKRTRCGSGAEESVFAVRHEDHFAPRALNLVEVNSANLRRRNLMAALGTRCRKWSVHLVEVDSLSAGHIRILYTPTNRPASV